MRARCVLYVYRRPADTLCRRTARPRQSKPEDSTNTTPSSASSLPDVLVQVTPPRRWPVQVPPRTVVPEVTTLRTRRPRPVVCPAAHRLTVTTRTASNRLAGSRSSKYSHNIRYYPMRVHEYMCVWWNKLLMKNTFKNYTVYLNNILHNTHARIFNHKLLLHRNLKKNMCWINNLYCW